MINALDAILIALMHTVDANEAGASVGGRSAPFADRDAGGPGLGEDPATLGIAPALAQVVEMADRNRRQLGIARVAVAFQRAPHQMHRRRAGERVVQTVGFGQQGHIRFGEAPDKTMRWRSPGFLQPTRLPILRHQARHLLSGVARRPFQITQHHGLLRPLQASIAKTPEHRFDVSVPFFVLTASLKVDFLRRRQKFS